MSAEIDEYLSLRFQDIRKKPKCHGRTHGRTDGRTDNVKTIYPTTNKVCGGIKNEVTVQFNGWIKKLSHVENRLCLIPREIMLQMTILKPHLQEPVALIKTFKWFYFCHESIGQTARQN